MRKKGFTLIELLAVILILAIIAVIVTPIISKIIDEAKTQADKRSAEKYVRAAQTFYVESQVDEYKRSFLGSNIIDKLDLENTDAKGMVVAYSDGTTEMAIKIGTKCFTKTTTQDIKDIQVSKDLENCVVHSSNIRISNINSGDSSIVITMDNSSDPSITITTCKYGVERGNLSLDGTISGNTCTLESTTVGERYYYEITLSDGSKTAGDVQGGTGDATPINTGGGSYAGGGSGGSTGGSGSGSGGSGSGGGTGVAAPVLTEANGRTVYTGRMISPVQIKYFNVTTGTKCDIVDYTGNNGNTTNGMNSGCMKFYAYMEDNLSYTMIADRNLDDSPYYWASTANNGSGPVGAYSQLKTFTDSWQGTVTPKNYIYVYMMNGTESAYRISYETDGAHARFITTDEIARITGNTSFNSVTTGTDGWFYLDGGTSSSTGQTWQTQIATSSEQSAYKWLFNYTVDCTNYGCSASGNNRFGYWTSDAVAGTTSDAWLIGSNGALNFRSGGNNHNSPTPAYNSASNYVGGVYTSGATPRWTGIRPVITVLKSVID